MHTPKSLNKNEFFNEIYLDANASHPLLSSVKKRLAEALASDSESVFGNPSSIHITGQRARAIVAKLKKSLTEFLGRPDPEEFILLSGATEAINLGLRSFASETIKKNKRPRVLTTTIEHSAVLETAKVIDPDTVLLKVDKLGQIDLKDFENTLRDLLADSSQDVLLCLQLANNETGSFYNFDSILPLYFSIKKDFQPKLSYKESIMAQGTDQRVFLFLDGAQALGKLDETELRKALHYADYLSLSGHKMGAPAGIGSLWVRPGAPFEIQITGGKQERSRRGGTHNILGIVGWETALSDWSLNGSRYRENFKKQKSYLLKNLESRLSGFRVVGDTNRSLGNTLNFYVEGCPEESLLFSLDLDGVRCSSGSACNSGSLKPSRVLLAMGLNEEDALSSVRLSWGAETSDQELETFINKIEFLVNRIRKARIESQNLDAESQEQSPTFEVS